MRSERRRAILVAIGAPRGRRRWSLGVNSDCMQKIGILLIIVVPVVLLVWWTGGFGVSRTVRSERASNSTRLSAGFGLQQSRAGPRVKTPEPKQNAPKTILRCALDLTRFSRKLVQGSVPARMILSSRIETMLSKAFAPLVK